MLSAIVANKRLHQLETKIIDQYIDNGLSKYQGIHDVKMLGLMLRKRAFFDYERNSVVFGYENLSNDSINIAMTDSTGTPYGVDRMLESIKNDKDNAPLFDIPKSKQIPECPKQNPWSKQYENITNRGILVRHYPRKAAQFMREVGKSESAIMDMLGDRYESPEAVRITQDQEQFESKLNRVW